MLDLSKYSEATKIMALRMTGQVGPRTFEMLIAHFTTVENILLAEEDELLELPGIGPARSKGIFGADSFLDRAQNIIDNLEASDTKVVTCLDPIYPQMLYELNDPPLLLYYQGHLPLESERRVAVIGSQNVSVEGIADAVLLARKLVAEGAAIVGGLARGIDTAGHMGALKDNGVTYAVLPSGFNQIHPAENQALTREIVKDGGLISEYLPDTPAASGYFVSRNRLIVGLSHAVVLGEISAESVGTLDAARCCQELGKLLFMLVGRPHPHYDTLIELGAIPLAGVDDYPLVIKALV